MKVVSLSVVIVVVVVMVVIIIVISAVVMTVTSAMMAANAAEDHPGRAVDGVENGLRVLNQERGGSGLGPPKLSLDDALETLELIHASVEAALVKIGSSGMQSGEEPTLIKRDVAFVSLVPDAEISVIDEGNQLIDRGGGGDNAQIGFGFATSEAADAEEDRVAAD